jgi:eukaryotic-like serine/threonine-protein kinase
VKRLLEMYRSEPDAGLHGAAEWTLRRWGYGSRLDDENEVLKRNDRNGRRWYVNSQGQLMVLIDGPVEFLMSSPRTEHDSTDDETLHRHVIGYSFAIASKQVSVARFQNFLDGSRRTNFTFPEKYSPDPMCPQINVTWYDAAAYCNWLSEQDGLPEAEYCYEPNGNGEYAEGMKIVHDFLDRKGYRLPTDAEFEYACRAGTISSRYFGGSDILLDRYAWFQESSQVRTWPTGILKPNDFGLFDTIGNVWQWCHDYDDEYIEEDEKAVVSANNDVNEVVDGTIRLLRGGAFNNPKSMIRSAVRFRVQASYRNVTNGFRPVRIIGSENLRSLDD